MSQLKKGALLSYATIIITNLVGLVLTPFVVHKLGDSEYGLYLLIGSFVAYLSLMDLGLNNTIVRFVSKYRAEKDLLGERKFLGTTMLIYLAISTILVIVGICLYINLDKIFGQSLSLGQMAAAKIMFLILIFNVAITLPGGTFTALCTAYGEFVFPRALGIIKYLLRAATVYAILTMGGKSISLVVIDTIFSLLVILITFYYCVSKLKVKFVFKESNKDVIRKIFKYSIWIFILGLIRSFQWNAGQIILGINENTVIVAIFGIGLMLGGYFGAFSGVINTLLLPKAAQMIIISNSPKELTDTMIKVGRINIFISLLILSGFIVLGKEFILLWVGESYLESWNIALIIMFATCIPLTQSFGMSILEIKDKVKYRAIGTLISTSIAVLLGYFLSTDYGFYGILIPIAVAMFINTIINNVLFVIYFKFQIVTFYKKTFLFQIVYTLVFVGVGVLFKTNLVIDSWFKFVVAGGSYSILYVLFYSILLLTKEEKSYLSKRI
ncbi:oligosaccharide flippase family protein [Ancylomarina sp. YFZ004]